MHQVSATRVPSTSALMSAQGEVFQGKSNACRQHNNIHHTREGTEYGISSYKVVSISAAPSILLEG